MITIDDFKKIEIKLGTIVEAEIVPDADKLLKLKIDFGLKPVSRETGSPDQSQGGAGLGEVEMQPDIRQVVSGIRAYYPEPSALVGTQIPVLTNLEPRMIKGLESNGMIVAAGDAEHFTLLQSNKRVANGTQVR